MSQDLKTQTERNLNMTVSRYSNKSDARTKSPGRRDATPRVGAEFIARETARAIERGEYSPGQRLREQEIADRYGLSRAPVREALRLLESQGLVVIEAMRGARVVHFNEASFHEILLIRSALSSVIVELAAAAPPSRLKYDFVAQAKGLLEQAMGDADVKTVYQGVRNHIRMLAKVSPSTRASSMMLGLGAGREAFQMRALRTKSRRIQVARNWLKLATAIQEGDTKSAVRTIQKLYEESAAFLFKEIDESRQPD